MVFTFIDDGQTPLEWTHPTTEAYGKKNGLIIFAGIPSPAVAVDLWCCHPNKQALLPIEESKSGPGVARLFCVTDRPMATTFGEGHLTTSEKIYLEPVQ